MNEQFILTLIEKFGSANIGELNLQEGNLNLVLRKVMPEQAGHRNCLPETEIPPAQVHLGIPANTAAEDPGGGEKITSPIVATFYAAPSPDSPVFVNPGSKVKAGDTLCILEAMKMMNHLEAEFDCEITETHAASGDFVEYGQTLFTVKRI